MDDTLPGATVNVPEAPAIPGLAFRRYRDEADFRHMIAVRAGCVAADRIDVFSTDERIPTVEDLTAWFAAARTGDPPFDPIRDMLFAERDGRVIGYNRVTWWPEEDGTHLYLHLGYLLPAHRRQGLGRAMLRWAEARARAIAAAHPGPRADVYGANATSDERELTSLLRAEGYTPVFSVLEMELSDVAALANVPAMPDGLETRPVGPEHYRALWEATNDAYRGRDVIMVLPTEEDYQEEYVHNPYLDPALIQAAWAGDDIAGLVRCETLPGPGPHGYGVVAQVAVRPAWRRRGLAYGLLLRGLHALRARGIQMVRLDVRQDNATHAQDLYERAGFHVLKEHVRYRKPMR